MKNTQESPSQKKSLFYSAYTSMMTWLNALSASISLWWNTPGIFSSIWNSIFPSKVDNRPTDKSSKEKNETVVQDQVEFKPNEAKVDASDAKKEAAALKIQATYRDYLIRKKTKIEVAANESELHEEVVQAPRLTIENDVTLNAKDVHAEQLESNGTKSQNLTRHIPTCLGLVAGMALLPKSLEVFRKNPKALTGLAMFATVGIGTGLLCNSVLSGKKNEVKAEDTPEILDEPKGGSVFELAANAATFGFFGFAKNALGYISSDEENSPKKAFR